MFPVVLYGCETWSLTLRAEHRVRAFEKRVLSNIFGSKNRGVAKTHNGQLYNLYPYTRFIELVSHISYWVERVHSLYWPCNDLENRKVGFRLPAIWKYLSFIQHIQTGNGGSLVTHSEKTDTFAPDKVTALLNVTAHLDIVWRLRKSETLGLPPYAAMPTHSTSPIKH